jgi:hypothetical protein
MGVQVNEGGRHSMTPPIADSLLSEPCLELVERHSKTLSPFTCSLGSEWCLIEQRTLLGEGCEACQAHRHQTEPDPPTEAPLEQ